MLHFLSRAQSLVSIALFSIPAKLTIFHPQSTDLFIPQKRYLDHALKHDKYLCFYTYKEPFKTQSCQWANDGSLWLPFICSMAYLPVRFGPALCKRPRQCCNDGNDLTTVSENGRTWNELQSRQKYESFSSRELGKTAFGWGRLV